MNFLIVNMKREKFFQDLLLNNIKGLKFDSAFEAGCGFGWNINRLKNEFPEKNWRFRL